MTGAWQEQAIKNLALAKDLLVERDQLRSRVNALEVVIERRDADLAAAQEDGANADDCIGRLHGQLDDAEAELDATTRELAECKLKLGNAQQARSADDVSSPDPSSADHGSGENNGRDLEAD